MNLSLAHTVPWTSPFLPTLAFGSLYQLRAEIFYVLLGFNYLFIGLCIEARQRQAGRITDIARIEEARWVMTRQQDTFINFLIVCAVLR